MRVKLIEIQEIQKMIKQRKVVSKKDRGKRKSKSKIKKELNDESEKYLDIIDDEMEIFDYIEIEI